MYSKKLVACVKVNGKILREDGDIVTLPFGSEYSILLKNLDSVRMQVRIFIDGKDATGWIIVNANSNVELERFITNGNLLSGNRFKFVERTEAIENYRGVREDDGLIRIEYAVEKRKPFQHYYDNTYANTWVPASNNGTFYNSFNTGNFLKSSVRSSGIQGASIRSVTTCSATLDCNEQGVTVPGSVSDQKFVMTSGFETEQSEVLVIHLKGTYNSQKVSKPVTVDIKKTCVSCGTKNKSNVKFCRECGTCLTIV